METPSLSPSIEPGSAFAQARYASASVAPNPIVAVQEAHLGMARREDAPYEARAVWAALVALVGPEGPRAVEAHTSRAKIAWQLHWWPADPESLSHLRRVSKGLTWLRKNGCITIAYRRLDESQKRHLYVTMHKVPVHIVEPKERAPKADIAFGDEPPIPTPDPDERVICPHCRKGDELGLVYCRRCRRHVTPKVKARPPGVRLAPAPDELVAAPPPSPSPNPERSEGVSDAVASEGCGSNPGAPVGPLYAPQQPAMGCCPTPQLKHTSWGIECLQCGTILRGGPIARPSRHARSQRPPRNRRQAPAPLVLLTMPRGNGPAP